MQSRETDRIPQLSVPIANSPLFVTHSHQEGHVSIKSKVLFIHEEFINSRLISTFMRRREMRNHMGRLHY